MALAAFAPLLPAAIGAIGGGMHAASQGKNPLEIGTAALIGGGLGASGGALSRMAGTALAGSPLAVRFAPNLYRAGSALPSWVTGMKSMAVNPATQARLGRQAIAGLTGAVGGTALSLTTPALAAGLAGVPGSAIRGATSAAGAAGVPGLGSAPDQNPMQFAGNAIPPGLDPQFGAGSPYGNMFDATNPLGYAAAQRLMSEKEMDTQLRNATLQGNLIAKFSEEAKKAELARQLYANTARTNLATQQQLLLGGVGTARQMGLNAAGQIGSALTSQYQYG